MGSCRPFFITGKKPAGHDFGRAGHLDSERGQLDEADRAYAENLQLARARLIADPKSGDRLSDLMLAIGFLGETQTLKSIYMAAVATLAEGVNLGEQLIARDYANGEW